MWIKDVDGNLVNLLNMHATVLYGHIVEVKNYHGRSILYNGDNAAEYMAELEKELAAFGKMIRVEVQADSEKCTCGKGLDIEPPDHDLKCSFFVPF